MKRLLAFLLLASIPGHRGQEETTQSFDFHETTETIEDNEALYPRADPGILPWETTESPYANVPWPKGTYGFPATDTEDGTGGCPDSTFTLSMRAIRTQQLRNEDKYFEPNNMKGKYKKRTLRFQYMIDYFCTRFVSKGSTLFPPGSYCVNMASSHVCPPRMSEGFIQFDSMAGSFSRYGRTPYGRYGEDTRYYYCCMTDRHDGSPKIFPSKVPFFLYRRGGKCEPVLGMTVQEQKVQYDTADTTPWTTNGDTDGGVTPDHTLNDVILHLCYYTPYRRIIY